MYQILAYINYWLHQVDEHSLHSPFLFDFYTDLIKHPSSSVSSDIEDLRKNLLQNHTQIDFNELGAGSRINQSNKRKISSIAKHSTTPLKFSLFLKELIKKYDYQNILELGTSLGLNTLYLSDKEELNITTIEGEATIGQLAQSHFAQLKRKNIQSIIAPIDELIDANKLKNRPWDLIYLDANHQYVPTLKYFDEFTQNISPHGVVVIDDIHWSAGMNKAWKEILQKPEVTLTIDLFEAGLVYLNPELPKENYILKF